MVRDEEFFQGMGVKLVTGSRYLGGFIGDRESETTWLDEKLQEWIESVRKILGVDYKHPHSDYVVLHKSLQQEW